MKKIWPDEASRRFFATIDFITDAIFLIDRSSMRFVQMNNAACCFHNQTRDQLLSIEPWKLLATSREALEQTYDTLIASGLEAKPLEILRQSRDGSPLWVEIRHHALCFEDNSTLVCMIRDITERKLAEANLLTNEVRFRSVFDKAFIGMAIADLQGVLINSNQSLAQMLGYTQHELIGMNLETFTHADDFAVERAYLEEIRTGSRLDYRMNKRYLTKSGEQLWVDLQVTGIPDEQGQTVNAIGLMVDITERKRAEAELRIAAVAFQSREGMMLTDAEGIILRVNYAFTQMTGYSAEEAVGQTPRLLQSGRHDDAYYNKMWEIIKRTGKWQGEVWDKRKNGDVYPKWLSISAVKDENGLVSHYVGSHSDNSEHAYIAEKINDLAYFDQLTNLPNRVLLQDRLKQFMAASSRSGCYGGLMFIDLDHFKTLNETQGHQRGDLLLKQVALRLSECVREGDTVARLGGDEFMVHLAGLTSNEAEAATHIETVAVNILASLNQCYQLDDIDYHGTASIGITMFTSDKVQLDDLMIQVDLAMYKAKEAGRNAWRFFDPLMESAMRERAVLEGYLRRALAEQQFLLHYQAQVVGDNRIIGAEVLVRWQHPVLGMVSPADFIPLAEETGLILPLGLWVLETACTQLASWASQPEMADLKLAVNVSGYQLGQADFVNQVLAVLENTGANPERLSLELTESLLLNNLHEIIEKMFVLKSKGVSFSLDDFGTGYSSLSYLKRLPLDQLKIDQSFVRDILVDPNDAAISRTIVALGYGLSLGVIAEGVESEAQKLFLAKLGCHVYQGYFFSRPLPLDEFETLCSRGLLEVRKAYQVSEC